MNDLISMNYKQFKAWCNERACDGQWSMLEAMICIDIMKRVDSAQVKGWFKKKYNEQAKEEAWEKIKQELLPEN